MVGRMGHMNRMGHVMLWVGAITWGHVSVLYFPCCHKHISRMACVAPKGL
jgi:hypothetical protein